MTARVQSCKLIDTVLQAVFHNVAKLLRSAKITTSTSERSLLKNLGSWLGMITLARNQPVQMRNLDVKELVCEGYETGRLIAVMPFVSKLLEGARDARIFRPPNPWTMGLMALLRELYELDDLKMNIKFEIEVLCKNLGLRVDEVPPGRNLPRRRAPAKEKSPDFNVKRPAVGGVGGPPGAHAFGAPGGARGRADGSAAGVELGGAGKEPFEPALGAVPGRRRGGRGRRGRDGRRGRRGRAHSGRVLETTVIPNLTSYVTVNAALPQQFARVPLKRAVPVAVDRAIREIIQPVVERSVTIACITTKELVAKDFAAEPDEARMRHAAQLMVANLAGSLALVTCKEPLRASIGNHLRTLLAPSGAEPSRVDYAVQVCSGENLDLGCMLIEKAATERAVRDVDEALAASFSARASTAQLSPGQPFVDSAIWHAGRYPAALPERSAPKAAPVVPGVAPTAGVVYEQFARAPRQPTVARARARCRRRARPARRPRRRPSPARRSRRRWPARPRPRARRRPRRRRRRRARPSRARAAQPGAAAAAAAARRRRSRRRPRRPPRRRPLPPLTVRGAIEMYQALVQRLDATSRGSRSSTARSRRPRARRSPRSARPATVALASDAALLTHRVEPAARDEAARPFCQLLFKRMRDAQPRDGLLLEARAVVLRAVADACDADHAKRAGRRAGAGASAPRAVRKEVVSWIVVLPLGSEAELATHRAVLVQTRARACSRCRSSTRCRGRDRLGGGRPARAPRRATRAPRRSSRSRSRSCGSARPSGCARCRTGSR